MNLPLNSSLRLLLALMCATAVLAIGNSVQGASAKEERAFNAAVVEFSDGWWARAERRFDQFVDDYPNSEHRPMARLLQAQALYQLHDYSGAVRLLTANMNRAGSLEDEYRFWTAETQLLNGENAAAAESYAKLVNDFPYSPRRLEAAVGEATAISRLGQTARVVELLTKPDGAFASAVQRSPTNEFVVRGLLILGQAQLARGEFADATTALDPLAGQQLPAALDWRVQGLRCRILLAQDQAEEAWQTSTNLPALATSSSQSRSQLLAETASLQAEILERLNRLTDAVAVLSANLTNGVPVERQREALLKIAQLQMTLGKPGDARQTLNKFLTEHTNAPAVDAVFLALGELDLKQQDAGVPMSGTVSTNSTVTNRLQRANVAFDGMLKRFPNSPLKGRALLDKGWCSWLSDDITNSLPLFRSAAEELPHSEEKAVALFKWADAQLACGDPGGALTNYNDIVENFVDLNSVKTNLLERALYQSARAALRANDMDAASKAVAKILDLFPNGPTGDGGLLLVGQGFADRNDPTRARELFNEFLTRRPDSPLVPQVRLAMARSYEQEGSWQAAVTNYDDWLTMNTNDNAVRAQAEFYRAWATYRAGQETNALTLFTNFVARYSDSDLAPAAQWWVGDFYFRRSDFLAAEKNYKLLFQTWPTSKLSYEARLAAGRAALGRAGYAEAINHFTNLTSDVNCPADLKVQAKFAYGGALMLLGPGDTNKTANLQLAIQVFGTIPQDNPASEQAALAWGEIGQCYLQLAAQDGHYYTNSMSAFQQATNLAGKSLVARSAGQVGIGLVLEKMAALNTGEEQNDLLNQALSNYLDVFYDDGADRFWVKEAGLKALPLIDRLGTGDRNKFIDHMEELLPFLKASLEKKRIGQTAEKN